jgi:hypothetical protein
VTGERCIHELPPDQCGQCRPRPRRVNRALFGPWVQAQWPGECAGPCGTEIRPGDQIRSDGEGSWLCQRCGSDAGR